MTTDSARTYLIAYDITEDRRRTNIANTLGAHGNRIQFSVFLVDARPARLIRLKDALCSIIDPSTDSIVVCDLGPTKSANGPMIEFIGCTRPMIGDGPMIL
jgi:CRISPR-associated protein Cas2